MMDIEKRQDLIEHLKDVLETINRNTYPLLASAHEIALAALTENWKDRAEKAEANYANESDARKQVERNYERLEAQLAELEAKQVELFTRPAPPASIKLPDEVTAEDVRWMLRQIDHDNGISCRIEHAEYIGALMWNACIAEAIRLNDGSVADE